jgi:hypothetical protein
MVAGEIQFSKIILTPSADGKSTNAMVEVNTDPKGMLPKWIINLVQENWPIEFFENMTKIATKRRENKAS